MPIQSPTVSNSSERPAELSSRKYTKDPTLIDENKDNDEDIIDN